MSVLIFIRKFFLWPTVFCVPAAYVALRFTGWPRALAVGFLTGVAIFAWAVSSILAWKHAHDARQELEEAERALHELYDDRDRQAVYEEFNL